MSQERDTHFIGFARALLNDIFDDREGSLILGRDLYPQDNERVAQHIARRAFDFADHVIKHLHGSNLDEIKVMGLARFLEEYGKEIGYERVPDMTEFPE